MKEILRFSFAALFCTFHSKMVGYVLSPENDVKNESHQLHDMTVWNDILSELKDSALVGLYSMSIQMSLSMSVKYL